MIIAAIMQHYSHMIVCIQYTFQAVLSTDGKSSFATFSYNSTADLGSFISGFKGERSGRSNIGPPILTQEETYIYRIDGTTIQEL